MISDIDKAIAKAQNEIAALQKKKEAALNKQLGSLHKSVGFATRAELIAVLQGLESAPAPKKRGRKPGKKAAKKVAKKAPKKAAKPAKKPAKKAAKKVAKKAAKKTLTKTGKVRAPRTKMTPELKGKIVAALKAGGKGAAVAKQFGVSIPTIHNIKKAAGLTKSRK